MDTPTLSPEELLRQRLSQMLARGVNPAGQPGTNGTAPPAPAPGTGAAANAGSDPTKPAPPTLTPTTTQGNSQPATGGGAAPAQKPYQTDEDWAKANPMAVPPKPDYQAPSMKSALAHGLAFGAMEFGRPGEGARANEQWASQLQKERDAATNYPTTLHQAREKEEMGQADLAGKEATTAETVKRTQLMGTEGEPKTTREALERQFRDQTQKGDQNGANTTLDMMKRLYPNEFKSADAEEMAKIPPQVLSQSGPKPVTPEWSAPGQPPKTYNSTAEAQAAWGAKVQELQTKAQSPEGKIDPLIEGQIGPQPDRAHFPPGPAGDIPFANANKAWAKAGEAVKNEMTAAGQDSRGKSFGQNRPTQVLDVWNGNRPVVVSAKEAEENPDRYVTQSGGQAALPKEALINDIRVSGQNVEKNLSVLDSTGFDRAALAAALGNPETTATQYLQALPRGALDDRAQQFVTDIFNLREQAMALRSVLGAGAGSEDVRKAILATLPGIASPDKGFAEKQIKNLEQVLNRVERGVPSVPLRGGPTDRTPAPGAAAPPATTGGFADWKAKQAAAGQ